MVPGPPRLMLLLWKMFLVAQGIRRLSHDTKKLSMSDRREKRQELRGVVKSSQDRQWGRKDSGFRGSDSTSLSLYLGFWCRKRHSKGDREDRKVQL